MLKTALFDCTINEKCCSVDGGRGICPLFSSSPRGIWQLKSPQPREFAIQGKKNANAQGSARGGGPGRRWNWLMHNPPRVPGRVSVTFKNDLVPELIMPRLIGVFRNGLSSWKWYVPIVLTFSLQGRPLQFQHQKYLWHVIVLREIS